MTVKSVKLKDNFKGGPGRDNMNSTQKSPFNPHPLEKRRESQGIQYFNETHNNSIDGSDSIGSPIRSASP